MPLKTAYYLIVQVKHAALSYGSKELDIFCAYCKLKLQFKYGDSVNMAPCSRGMTGARVPPISRHPSLIQFPSLRVEVVI